jgi:hypothetical protein
LTEIAHLIADPDTWEEPSADLGDRVVAAVMSEATLHRRGGPRRRPVLAAAAAAAFVLVGFVAVVLVFGEDPDWTVEIAGTPLAPDAGGTVLGWNAESGTRMILELTGLDPAPPGEIYELWLSEGSRHVSAGTFVEAGDDLELWAGVTRRDYPRIWITLEPLDDDPGPSSHTVLDTGE